MTAPSRDEVLARELERIRGVVERNVPRHRRPEAFHEDKSEVTADLDVVIQALRTGKVWAPRA